MNSNERADRMQHPYQIENYLMELSLFTKQYCKENQHPRWKKQ
jgi:hypothetical protein